MIPAADFARGLTDVLQAVEDATIEEDAVEEVLRPLLLAPAPGDDASLLRKIALEFGALVTKRGLREENAARVAALAELAWRVAHWASVPAALVSGVRLGHRLMELRDCESALRRLDIAILEASKIGDTLLPPLTVLAIECLSRLNRHAAVHERVSEWETGPGGQSANLCAIELLIAGTIAAAAQAKHSIAEVRAMRADSLYADKTRLRLPPPPILQLLPPVSAARIHSTWGDAALKAGNPMRAIELYQRGRTRAFEEHDARGAARCLANIGIVWENLSEFARGAKHLEQAAAEIEQAGDSKQAAYWRKKRADPQESPSWVTEFDDLPSIGARLQMTEQVAPDDEARLKAILAATRGYNLIREASARNVLANCYSLSGRDDQALAAAEAALIIVREIGNAPMSMTFGANYAIALVRAGRWREAKRAAQTSFDLGQKVREASVTAEARQTAAVAVAGATDILLRIAAVEHRDSSDGHVVAPDPQEVAMLVQLARSRTLNAWLEMRDWGHEAGAPEIARAVHDLIQAEVVVEAASQAGRGMAQPLRQHSEAANALTAAAARVGLALPSIDPAASVDKIVSSAPSDASILDLSATAEGIVGLLLRLGTEPRSFSIPWSRTAREQWTRRLHAAFTIEMTRGSARGGAWRARSAVHAPVADAAKAPSLEEVYGELDHCFVHPLRDAIGPAPVRLICALHAELFSIPLWSIARAYPDIALSMVPSLKTLVVLAKRPASLGYHDVKVGDATNTLPMVPLECNLLPGHRAARTDITELENELVGARRIHFAGHGDFIADDPYSSGIILAGNVDPPYAVATRFPGCVRLTIPGILRRCPITDCELVVLSACSTGIPRAHAASEFSGVPAVFFLAGAREVIAASWPAHDGATAVLMKLFYERLDTLGSVTLALSAARKLLASMNRSEILAIFERDDLIPIGDIPFASPIFTDAFMHFGLG